MRRGEMQPWRKVPFSTKTTDLQGGKQIKGMAGTIHSTWETQGEKGWKIRISPRACI